MLLNEKLIRQLEGYWIADQEHPHRGRERRPIPSLDAISSFVDTLFEASLRAEEGTPVKTTVVLVSPADFDSLEVPKRRNSTLTIRFNSPLEFSAAVIGKIGAIADPATALLLADASEPQTPIWGLALASAPSSLLTQVSVATDETRHFLPDCFTATIRGIGSIAITRAGSNVVWLEQGGCRPAQPSALHGAGLAPALWRLIGIAQPTNGGFCSAEDSQVWGLFVAAMESLLNAVGRHGGGGTIIILPENATTAASQWFVSPWSFHGDFEFSRLSSAALKFQRQVSAQSMVSQLFAFRSYQVMRERANAVARMSRVDGAVLLRPSLDPIAFGAKLKAEPWKGLMTAGAVRFDAPQELDFAKLGTRHNSARDFVGACPGAVAFVASTDGPIRAMVKTDDHQVSYWADCRDSMFI